MNAEFKDNQLIMLADVVREAKQLWPGLVFKEQIMRFAQIQQKIIEFTSDRQKADTAYAKLKLLFLLMDGFETCQYWQMLDIINIKENN